MSRQDEIERLKQAIAAQEALRGILPDKQLEATFPERTPSGRGGIPFLGFVVFPYKRRLKRRKRYTFGANCTPCWPRTPVAKRPWNR